jgi:hypothetical protein
MIGVKPLVQGVPWSVLQTALRLAPSLFARHEQSGRLFKSGLSPRGDGDAVRIDRPAHRQTGRLGSGPALGPNLAEPLP